MKWFAKTPYRQGSPSFRGFPFPAHAPSLKARGQTDSCCFLCLGTTLMLQSQSPSREDGVSLSWSRGGRWDYTALYPQMWTRLWLEKDDLSWAHTNVGLHPQVGGLHSFCFKVYNINYHTGKKALIFLSKIPLEVTEAQ